MLPPGQLFLQARGSFTLLYESSVGGVQGREGINAADWAELGNLEYLKGKTKTVFGLVGIWNNLNNLNNLNVELLTPFFF